MKTKMLGLLAIAGMLLATSCSQDMTDTHLPSNDLVDVFFSVGLEGAVGTRATRVDGTSTRISDGTRATELYFAIYDKNDKSFIFTPQIDESSVDAEPLLLQGKDGEGYYKVKMIKYPFTFSCQLVKGMDYQIVFWAQSNDAEYYDLKDFPFVEVKYKDANGDPYTNNDEMRDAFSVSYPIKAGSTATSHDIVLTRPLSQINVGMTEEAWEKFVGTGTEVAEAEIQKLTSSMIISNAATKFNVRQNCVVKNDITGDITYQAQQIPFSLTELNGVNVPEEYRYLYVDTDFNAGTPDDTDEDEDYRKGCDKFRWMSMCYILADDEIKEKEDETYGTVIDRLEINICDKLKSALENVPVKRNYRTNILFDEGWWADMQLVIKLDRAYDDSDYNGYDEDGKYKEIEN